MRWLSVKQNYFEDLTIAIYPSNLLHNFGVNGKISGSVYACGEMEGVIPIVHGPIGCGYHYRFSARRRHYPYFNLISSELTEEDIIYGGEDKLYSTIIDTYERYNPKLILIIPSPISDIINDDIEVVAKRAREKGINVISIKSELFSHRDKNYVRKRMAEVSKQKFGKGKNIDFDIMGCGYTEALYAMVDNVMVEQKPIQKSINIETIGWGKHGKLVIGEVEGFLAKAGITINSHFPSTSYENIVTLPKASLNIVRRLRWAKKMKEKFGTPYLQINTTGRYSGLDGICNFYMDVGKELDIALEMEELVDEEWRNAKVQVENDREEIKRHKVLVITRNLRSLPYLIKKYVLDYGVNISCCAAVLTDQSRKNLNIDDNILDNLLNRVKDSLNIYAPNIEFALNPDDDKLLLMSKNCDAIMGTDDFYYEKFGIPVINPIHEDISLSFESYIRTVKRIRDKLENIKNKPDLILNYFDFDRNNYLILDDKNIKSSREMWNRMWLNRKDG